MATKKEQLQAELEKAKAQLQFAVEQDEKDFVQSEIDDLQKQIDEIKDEAAPAPAPAKKTAKEPKKKAEKAEKPKAETKAPAPGDADCEDLKEVDEKAKKAGYNIDELVSQAKKRSENAKKAAEKRADAPKKTPATKNKEAVEKVADKVAGNIEKRVEKGEVSVEEIDKLISKYEESIKELKELRAKISGEKKAKGGYAKGGKAGSITKADVKKLYDKANKLFYGYIGNSGKLDYSDKEYGYLSRELEDIEVGYFKDDEAYVNVSDSSYSDELREEGFEMTAEDAYNTLKHRIESIEEELEEGEKSKGGKASKYAKGGTILEGHFN